MPTTTQSFALSVLVHRDGDAWVAQCVEYDLAAQGPDKDVAQQRFMHMLTAQILLDLKDRKEPFAGLGPAPQRYFDQLVNKRAGPDLPVYVPILNEQPRVNARARFFVEESRDSHA